MARGLQLCATCLISCLLVGCASGTCSGQAWQLQGNTMQLCVYMAALSDLQERRRVTRLSAQTVASRHLQRKVHR